MHRDGCEREFGMTDWYQRFGFMYFEFMNDKYKRTDQTVRCWLNLAGQVRPFITRMCN